MEAAEFLELTPRTVINICTTYEGGGLERALRDDPRPGRPPEFDDRVKSKIVATVCGDPPEGFDRWTLDLLKEQVERRAIVASIGKETIRLILREHDLKPWQQRMWCVPRLDDEFVRRMEDVLDVYERPYNPGKPVVCLDEKPVVLHGEKRAALPMTPGQSKRVDYEYVRKGTANVFCAVEPQVGAYFNKVTGTRDAFEFAQFLADLERSYRRAEKIVLVMDNLSTHTAQSLVVQFGPEAGTRLWKRFEVHYTPKHGSWLNQAEIAIGMYQRQCVRSTRTDSIKALRKKTDFWNRAINSKHATINWTFSKNDARAKFDYG